MIGFVKLAALSAAFSYSAVTAYNMPVLKLEAALGGKYQDRILPEGQQSGRATVVEGRVGESTSVPTRIPPIDVASR